MLLEGLDVHTGAAVTLLYLTCLSVSVRGLSHGCGGFTSAAFPPTTLLSLDAAAGLQPPVITAL